MRFRSSIAALAAALSVFDSATAAGNSAWASRKIYFVLTDRFARSDSSTSSCGNLGNYCGGTWTGIKNKLSYIQGMGFDAIWITPIVENTDGGYHGYWAKNIYNVNTNHGTADELKAMVTAAHNLGIYIMLDVVVNHMGKGDFSGLTPFNTAAYYHDYCVISDYTNQNQVEQCRFVSDLPDVKTEDSGVRSTWNSWISSIVSTYSFDGLRIDTARHVEKSFFPGFIQAAGSPYAIGEVYQGDPTYVGPYQSYIPGLLNYPLYYSLIRCYAQKASFTDLVNQMDSISADFTNPELLGNFLDNHDVNRFLNYNSDQTLLKNGLAYVMLARGIPILYYGTEQGYSGGADPANREDLWRSGYPTTGSLYQFIKTLNSVKASAGGLPSNDHVHLYTTANAYAFSRANGKVIVLTTNLGSSGSGQYCFNTPVSQGTVLKSALTGTTYTAGSNGNICVTVSGGNPEVLTQGSSTSTTTTTTRSTTSSARISTTLSTATNTGNCVIVTTTVYAP